MKIINIKDIYFNQSLKLINLLLDLLKANLKYHMKWGKIVHIQSPPKNVCTALGLMKVWYLLILMIFTYVYAEL
jgi:hypothetical protein